MTLLAEKRIEEALAEFEKADALSNGNIGAVEKTWANGFAGNMERARDLLAALPESKKRSPFDMAIIYTSLGENDKAIDQLFMAYQTRDPQIVPLKVFPPFETLRDKPKFTELLRKMNL